MTLMRAFVDSALWVALMDESDKHHFNTSAVFNGLKSEFSNLALLTTPSVVGEVLHLLKNMRSPQEGKDRKEWPLMEQSERRALVQRFLTEIMEPLGVTVVSPADDSEFLRNLSRLLSQNGERPKMYDYADVHLYHTALEFRADFILTADSDLTRLNNCYRPISQDFPYIKGLEFDHFPAGCIVNVAEDTALKTMTERMTEWRIRAIEKTRQIPKTTKP